MHRYFLFLYVLTLHVVFFLNVFLDSVCEIVVVNDDDNDYDDNSTKQEHFHEPYTVSQLYSTDQVNNMSHENKLNISN